MNKLAAEKIAQKYYNLGVNLALQKAGLTKIARPEMDYQNIGHYDPPEAPKPVTKTKTKGPSNPGLSRDSDLNRYNYLNEVDGGRYRKDPLMQRMMDDGTPTPFSLVPYKNIGNYNMADDPTLNKYPSKYEYELENKYDKSYAEMNRIQEEQQWPVRDRIGEMLRSIDRSVRPDSMYTRSYYGNDGY